jgi:phosphatidate cytidylyltransferase
MVYKNLFYRSIFTTILFILYLLSLNNNNFLLILATLIYLIIIFECFLFFKRKFFLIISYIFISLICFYTYFLIYFDLFLFNILIFVIILFDTFSYFTGLLFGKRYIFKKISPKKTLEGYLGGGFFTNIIIITFLLLYKDNINIINMLLLINSIIIFSIVGDLTESFFKRINNIKNSSSYLPGHGGFFDRFDSFIPSIIFLLLYSI